jgi:hypothetical protein
MTAKELLETMADLEARIAKIYACFAAAFRDVSGAGELWVSMGDEESHHADRLSLAASSAPPTAAGADVVDHVHRLASIVERGETQAAHAMQLPDALNLTADIEAAEAEHLHGPLTSLGEWANSLAQDAVMQHRQRATLEHAIQQFGTQAVRRRMAWQRFRD